MFFMRLSQSYDQSCGFGRFTLVSTISSQYLKKDVVLNCYSQTMFLLSCFWIYQVD